MLAFLLGLGVGLSLAAPPGPMNALIAREASRQSTAAGIRAGIGAPIADVLFLVLVLAGLREVQGQYWFQSALRMLAMAGALLLGYLAWSTTRMRPPKAAGPTAFWSGFAVALTNPYQIGWWLSGGVVLVVDQEAPFFIGLLTGIFGWVIAFSWAMHRGSRRWDAAAAIQVLSADLLLAFAMVVVLVGLT